MNDYSSSGSPIRVTIHRVLFAAGLLLGPGLAAQTPPPWHYVARIGLFDARHTAPDGAQASDVVQLGAGGFSIGSSALYVGQDDVAPSLSRAAQSGWLADPAGAVARIGLYDAVHTRDDGREESFPLLVNRDGTSVGYSARFSGHRFIGTSAWVATASGATQSLGFYDDAHRAADGSTVSQPIDLNEANKFIGFSENPETGQRTGWIANLAGQINAIGLWDADHRAPDGHSANFPVALNDAGYVIGNADYYVADAMFPGSTAWVRRPDQSVRLVGFSGGIHTAPNGQHLSRVELLTESGFMAGWSIRYESGSSDGTGQTAWITHVDGPNRPVGFYTGEHLGPTGAVHSHIEALNERGYAIGTSFQYDGGTSEFDQAGSTAWIATPGGTTVRVGFYDAEHSLNGHPFNDVVAINGVDALIGSSARYQTGGAYLGIDAFVANAAGYTTKLALTDAMHTRNDGYHASYATAITDESGYVAGYSERFNGGADHVGRTAWVYTRSSRTFVRIEPSVRASDGFAESSITRLREDGTAVGYFRLFASDGSDLGERAFAYVPGRGVLVLDANVDTSVAGEGWSYFAEATETNAAGNITGAGARVAGATYGPGVFLLSSGTSAAAR